MFKEMKKTVDGIQALSNNLRPDVTSGLSLTG